jgi:hypothetical protein
MGSEDSMAFALSLISRCSVGRSAGGEVSAFEGENHASAIVAFHRSEMEGCTLSDVPGINHCSGLDQHATDLSVSFLRSEMEGRGLMLFH